MCFCPFFVLPDLFFKSFLYSSLLTDFPGLFFLFYYRSIMRRGVEFSKRMCLPVHGSGLSRTYRSGSCDMKHHCQDTSMTFIFVTFWHATAFPVQSKVIGWMENQGQKSCWVHVATEHLASTSLQRPGHLTPALTNFPSWFGVTFKIY